MISEYYSDDELISQLREHFDEEIDFNELLGMIVEGDDGNFILNVKGRSFVIDAVFCDVEEVE